MINIYEIAERTSFTSEHREQVFKTIIELGLEDFVQEMCDESYHLGYQEGYEDGRYAEQNSSGRVEELPK